nr:JAB domain-containing protein [Stakelama flava]
MQAALREQVLNGKSIGHADELIDYLRSDMAHLPMERCRVLLLDKKLRLIRDVKLTDGTIDEAPFFPREVFRVALLANASAIILVHNHPSGDPQPSRADVDATATIVWIAKRIGMDFIDHLIISRGGCSSFRALGLL